MMRGNAQQSIDRAIAGNTRQQQRERNEQPGQKYGCAESLPHQKAGEKGGQENANHPVVGTEILTHD